jgi:hypothetical protein
MPVIMSTRNLWKAIGGSGPLPPRSKGDVSNSRLGAWCGNVASFHEGDFIVAMNELTYTTLVFRFVPLPGFVASFSFSLGMQLAEIGAEQEAIESETKAAFDELLFRKNDNRSLLGSLNDVCFHVGWHLEGSNRCDSETILSIQRRLNEMPHVHHEPSIPNEGLRLVFHARGEA